MGRAQSGHGNGVVAYPTLPTLSGTIYPGPKPYTASSGTQPWGIAISPDGTNVYTANSSGNSIGMYDRASDGQLTAKTTATITAGGSGRNPRCILVTPNGKFVVAPNFSNADIGVYPRAASGGALSTATFKALPASAQPFGIALVGTNGDATYYVYVAIANQSIICQFSMDANTGVLTALTTSTIATGATAQGLAVSPDFTSLYCACNGGTVYQYSIDGSTRQLSQLSPVSVTCTGWPAYLVVSPDNKHVYTANDTGASLGQFTRDTVTNIGALTAISAITSYNGPWGIAMNPSGNNVYIAASDGNYVGQLTRNSSTGACTKLLPNNVQGDSYATGITSSVSGPYNMVCSPDGLNLYLCLAGSNNVATYNIQP